ncbi:MAG: hypothetical protein AB7Q17_05390 [Phycisphaerae bacterium]
MTHRMIQRPRFIALLVLALPLTTLGATTIDWWTADGGGGALAGADFTLSGTIGQPDAGLLVAGNVALLGGYWIAPPLTLGDLNCDGLVNNFDINAFVTAISDPALYDALYPYCDRAAADIDRNGLVNNFDINPFVECLLAGACP